MKKLMILALPLLFACSKPQNTCGDGAVKATLKDYTGLDGCTWVIELKNGERLEPLNLGEFSMPLQNGAEIWITYDVTPAASICMVGQSVTLTCLNGEVPD